VQPLCRLAAILILLAACCLAPGAAPAVPIALSLDPAVSSITPDAGAPQSLAGTLTLEVGALPVEGGATVLAILDLALVSSGGLAIALDPDSLSPGLFVLEAGGRFEVATALFLRLTQNGSPFDLAIPDLVGEVSFGAGGASVERLAAVFSIDSGGPGGILDVRIVAVPEPAAGLLVALGLAVLAARAQRGSRP
jgi:hypothetical protein